MTREETLEQEVQALRDLVNIQKQIIEALKLKADLQPVQIPYIQPILTTPQPIIIQPQPWPGYPAPYIGDLPPFGPIITSGVHIGSATHAGVSGVAQCVSQWQLERKLEQ